MKKIGFGILFSFLISTAFCQEGVYDKVFDRDIKTVLMYADNDDLSLPIWDLGSSKKLTLTFDDLHVDTRDFSYTIVHCNSEWLPSDLDQSEYIDGYYDDQISEYQSSFNTTINYTHYTLQLPNDYMRPMISGNYVVQVFESSNPDKVLINKQFRVVERKTDIKASVRNMQQGSYFYNDQELEIVVDYFQNEFYDIAQNIKIEVIKNRNRFEYLKPEKPDMINQKEFTYNNFTTMKLKGGNEFHHFNIKNIHYAGENIVNINFVNYEYHFQLLANKDRSFDEYIYKSDLNGLFKIDVTQSQYPETEADYCWVYFTLNMDVPMQQGDIYIWGALSNYEFSEGNKMTYNFEQKAYEGRLLIKQGYYNYQYALLEKGKHDFTYIEGNHAQTENSYAIYVYYHDFRGGYDRLIGQMEINSKLQ
jgi:Type 9 secretion system plug protein 1st domain